MAIGISILLGLAALTYVFFPMIQRASTALIQPAPVPGTDATTSQPGEQEQVARAALQEVEFDYQLGNIAEPDYRALRERYIHDAITGMKSRHEQEDELDEEIEKRLREIKENHEHTEH